MGKSRKRTRLLRVGIAAALLVAAMPSVVSAHEHLSPLDALVGRNQAGSAIKRECSTDPRDPALMKPGGHLCSDEDAAAQVPTGQERALVQHLTSEGERIAQTHAPSERTEIEFWAWTLTIFVAAGGAFVLFNRRRSPALSS
jgi:hypothetical protein